MQTKAEKISRQFFEQQSKARKRRLENLGLDIVYAPLVQPRQKPRQPSRSKTLDFVPMISPLEQVKPRQAVRQRLRQPQMLSPKFAQPLNQPQRFAQINPNPPITKQIQDPLTPRRNNPFGFPRGAPFRFPPFGGGRGFDGRQRKRGKKSFTISGVDPERPGVIFAFEDDLTSYSPGIFNVGERKLKKIRKKKGASNPLVGAGEFDLGSSVKGLL